MKTTRLGRTPDRGHGAGWRAVAVRAALAASGAVGGCRKRPATPPPAPTPAESRPAPAPSITPLPTSQAARARSSVRRRLDADLAPSRISLHLRAVTREVLLAEVGRQAGVRLVDAPAVPPTTARSAFDLDLDAASFWDALQAVCDTTGTEPSLAERPGSIYDPDPAGSDTRPVVPLKPREGEWRSRGLRARLTGSVALPADLSVTSASYTGAVYWADPRPDYLTTVTLAGDIEPKVWVLGRGMQQAYHGPDALSRIALRDAAGRALWRANFSEGRNMGNEPDQAASIFLSFGVPGRGGPDPLPPRAIGAPAAFEWRMVDRTLEVVVPFEFHDLPLP